MTFHVEELRVIAQASPVLLRMLREREERIINKMYGEFRNGTRDFLCAMAELACVRDQISEIKSAMNQLNGIKEIK